MSISTLPDVDSLEARELEQLEAQLIAMFSPPLRPRRCSAV